jgi:hypothetical protein
MVQLNQDSDQLRAGPRVFDSLQIGFSLNHCIQPGFEAQPATYPMGTEWIFTLG